MAYSELWVEEATEALRRGGISRLRDLADTKPRIAKAITGGDLGKLEADLAELFRRYGLRQLSSAGQNAARAAGGKWKIKPELAAEWNERLENKVVLLVESTEAKVRGSIKRLVSDALRESPRPTARELARRIARQWHGPGVTRRPKRGGQAWPGRGTKEERQQTADWTRYQRGLKRGERENLFSFERADTIARTELAQAENAAIADSFGEIGIEAVEWMAFPYNPAHDHPGARNHYRMRGKSITVAAMNGADRSQWFELPSGIRTPYPNWIGLPAGETVNCQCMVVPKRTRTRG
jgi:hypothetical protein